MVSTFSGVVVVIMIIFKGYTCLNDHVIAETSNFKGDACLE